MFKQNILVIKHGSLGDWIQATGAFRLIRACHAKANIIILTQSNYLPLAYACNYFDEIWEDNRFPLRNIISNFKIIKKLRSNQYEHVYDLQCSNRTNLYHSLILNKVKNWYGRAKGCSHFVPFNSSAHSVELSRDIIKSSGINDIPEPKIDWLKTRDLDEKIESFGKFVLFIPVSSKKHFRKRWTANGYAEVIDWLAKRNINSVLTGTEIDRNIIESIMKNSSTKPINLINEAGFAEMAELGRKAIAIIGSDTGPMHLSAATGTPSLVLFSEVSNPNKSRPWGSHVKVLQEKNLKDLSSDKVIAKLSMLLANGM